MLYGQVTITLMLSDGRQLDEFGSRLRRPVKLLQDMRELEMDFGLVRSQT